MWLRVALRRIFLIFLLAYSAAFEQQGGSAGTGGKSIDEFSSDPGGSSGGAGFSPGALAFVSVTLTSAKPSNRHVYTAVK